MASGIPTRAPLDGFQMTFPREKVIDVRTTAAHTYQMETYKIGSFRCLTVIRILKVTMEKTIITRISTGQINSAYSLPWE
jgi:hypothetical protein